MICGNLTINQSTKPHIEVKVGILVFCYYTPGVRSQAKRNERNIPRLLQRFKRGEGKKATIDNFWALYLCNRKSNQRKQEGHIKMG